MIGFLLNGVVIVGVVARREGVYLLLQVGDSLFRLAQVALNRVQAAQLDLQAMRVLHLRLERVEFGLEALLLVWVVFGDAAQLALQVADLVLQFGGLLKFLLQLLELSVVLGVLALRCIALLLKVSELCAQLPDSLRFLLELLDTRAQGAELFRGFLRFGLGALEDFMIGVAERLFACGANAVFTEFLQLLDALALLFECGVQGAGFGFGVGALLVPLV